VRLQTRLALLFGAVVTLACVAMGVLAYAAVAERMSAQVDESLLQVSAPLAEDLAQGRIPRDVVEDGDPRHGRDGRSTGGLLLPTQVLLPDGTVVPAASSEVTLPVDSGDVAIARSTAPTLALRDVTIDGAPFRMVTESDGGANGAIQVARDVSENSEVLAGLARLLALIGALVAALAALAGWVLARRSAHRLVQLTEAAEEVTATGRLDVGVPTAGSDEIARLGSAFDAMLLRLGQSREDQQRLVQDAGHELRTPLTSLRTNVHLLGRFEDMPPETRARVIADLDGETRELTHLVNEVVDLAAAGPQDEDPVPVLLADLARSVAARAGRRTGREVELALDGSVVLGRPGPLERAMWNLVENATKFSARETPIRLTVDRGRVLVRDLGPGIDPADLPHVFDRFFRSTSARSLPGSGLGLAIVRDVVESSGGHVFARNSPEGGAELGFQLPVLPDHSPPRSSS
jgi:two-component system sensor histidine kinase MprB